MRTSGRGAAHDFFREPWCNPGHELAPPGGAALRNTLSVITRRVVGNRSIQYSSVSATENEDVERFAPVPLVPPRHICEALFIIRACSARECCRAPAET